METVGVYLNVKPHEGGAYQYALSMLKAVSTAHRIQYNFIIYSDDETWKNICSDLNLPFKFLRGSFFQRGVLWLVNRIPIKELQRMTQGLFHPFWVEYRQKCLDLAIFPMPSMLGAISGAKSIITIYDIMHRYIGYFPEVGGRKVYKERDYRYGKICKYADGILVDSQLAKRQMIESYGEKIADLEKKVYQLPYTVPSYIYGEEDKIQTFDKYFYYPAQFWQHKNHKNLILAIAKLREKNIYINLVCTGKEKNSKEEIINLIKKNNIKEQVMIFDYVTNSQLIYLYKHARALVMPSYAGPTNIPPLEALALGCPMMVANNFAMSEQVGEAGLYFTPDSVDEIADCMEKLWKNDSLRDKLIQKGKEKKKVWGEKQFCDVLMNIINQVLCK